MPMIAAVPSDFQVCEDGGLYYVDELLAVSQDQRFLVGARVILDPFDKDGAPFHELAFGISLFDEERYSTEMIFDRGTAKRYLPSEVRPFVMLTVCAALPVLIGHVRPDLIFRQTAARRPPEKALSKHQMITDTLLGIGYWRRQMDIDAEGSVIWVFERGTEVENGED